MKMFICLLIFISSIARAETCGPLLAGPESSDVIAYFEALLDERILQISDLEKIVREMNTRALLGAKSTAQRIHARELEKYLAHADPHELAQWLNERSQGQAETSAAREEISQITNRREMAFIEFPVGGEQNVPLYNIEVMDTPVTQRMWEQVMGENPSHFKDQGATQANHPVENITWFSAATFANRVSEKMGLKPYYNFSRLGLKGDAAKGELGLRKGRVLKPGWLFQSNFQRPETSEGFRLPTQLESMRLVTFARREYQDLSKASYAWYAANSNAQTQAVGLLRQAGASWGDEIFDLFGNVLEWGNYWSQENDAIAPTTYGSSYLSDSDHVRHDRRFHGPSTRSPEIGLRLVRTVR